MVTTANLVSYYKSDTNGSFPDAHGSNPGTINGATYTASGKINGAYDYDGSNDYIQFSTTMLGTGDKTITFWINFDLHKNFNTIMTNAANGLSSADDGLSCYGVVGGTITFYVGNGATANQYLQVTSSTTFTTGTWYFIALRQSGTTLEIFVNGSSDASSSTTSGSETSTSTNMVIGRRNSASDHNFNGKLDEIAYWNAAKSNTDISDLYNSGSGLAYPFGATGWTGKINGVTDPAKINGLGVTSISTVNGQ